MIKKLLSNAVLAVGAATLIGCAGQSPEQARFSQVSKTLRTAQSPNAPGVQEGLAWLADPATTIDTSSHSLIYSGAHPDVVMAVVKRRGADRMEWTPKADFDSLASNWMIRVSPYAFANAFQAAIAASRPELAEQIAIHHAKTKGDYQPGAPLGAIPSIHALAKQGPNDADWEKYKHFAKWDSDDVDGINARMPRSAYVDPPGRGLMFRFAASRTTGNDSDFRGKHGWPRLSALKNAKTHSAGGDGRLASQYAAFIEKRQRDTLKFIYGNFGGDPNERLPYCFLRYGDPFQMCMEMTPTLLAARMTSKGNDYIHDDGDWRIPGRLQAFLDLGGDPNSRDAYGNTVMAYAKTGGAFPNDYDRGPLLDIGQLFAGAAIVAGAGYMAGEGAYDQAAQFLVGGLSDVANGTTSNLTGMLQEQQKRTAEANAQLERRMQVLREKAYITPETWASVPPKPATPQGAATSNGAAQGFTAAGAPGANGAASQQAQASAQQAGPAAIPAGMGSFSFTCPETKKTHTLPMPPVTGACLQAAKRMAYTTSCNMFEEWPEAHKAYQQACAADIYQ